MPKTETLQFEIGDSQWQSLRKKCLEPVPGKYSALYFLAAKVCGHERNVPLTPSAHYALCLFLERATGIPEIDEARVQLVQVARGFGKSVLATKCRTLQLLLQHDDYSVGIANERQELANAFLAMIKQEFEANELLRALFPERIPENFSDTIWKADRIFIKRRAPRPTSPSVLAAGAGATVTGVHVDQWVVDDLISDKAAENALRGLFTETEESRRWITRLPPLLCSPERDPITFIGTPWYAGDVYEFVERYFGGVESLSEKPDFECTWMLRLPGGEVQHLRLYRRGDLAVFRRPAIEAGRSIFPERWTLEELGQMETRPESAAFFQANYMLNPTAGAGSAFNMEWLKYYELDKSQIGFRGESGRLEWQPIRDLMCYLSVDPAFSDRISSARTAIPVVGTNGKELFLLEDFAERGLGVDDIGEAVVNFLLQYPVRKLFVETVVAQIAVADAIRRVAHARGVELPPLEEIKSHGREKKEFRIYGLEPWFKKGLFYIHPRHVNFKDEYSTFPRSALRDTLDALAFQRHEWDRVSGARSGTNVDALDRLALARVRGWAERWRRK